VIKKLKKILEVTCRSKPRTELPVLRYCCNMSVHELGQLIHYRDLATDLTAGV
jgi:hypothetical protein